MSDYEPTSPGEISLPSAPAVVEGGDRAACLSPRPPASPSGWPLSATVSDQAGRQRGRRSLSHMRRRLIAAAALMGSVTGLFIGLGTSPSASAAQLADTSSTGQLASVGGGSNARSGPATGGSSGTVGSVFRSSFTLSSFTLTTSAGQEMTVDEKSSTKYAKGTSSTSKSTMTKGEHVLLVGTVSSATIKATQVIVHTTGGGSKPSTAATVVHIQRGAAETSKQVGENSASYSQVSGTIVSGATANKVTGAALAACPGGMLTVS